ncbi:hypothetical protein [Nostoc sp. WHI]|uniref:hypothetical protein n=1 Tax=Nostoc sp. WHI TaxID=2650611 RepID=UPI0018C75D46|nr:hypothetical protein [Nostoc sp. WHI]
MTKNLTRIECPHCCGWRTYRNGYNLRKDGNIQRWYCQNCDRGFQERKAIALPGDET